MRSERSAWLAAAAALHFAFAPPAAATAGVAWIHVCGSGQTIPLPVPVRRDGNGQAACHAGCALTPDKKKARSAG